MSLTFKERTRRALQHKTVDRVPTQINYTRAMGHNMEVHFGVKASQLPDLLQNHLLRVDIDHKLTTSSDGKVKFDWWGVGYDASEEGYFPSVNPLAGSKDLDAFPWPDPHSPNLLDEAKALISLDEGQHFVVPNFGFALFERAWALRGFDTFLMDMVLDPAFAEELLERITQIQLALITRFVDLGIDGGYFGDDYGAQKKLLFSPKAWRKLIKPRLNRMFAPFRQRQMHVLMHSDGQIADVLPDLIEIGLTAYNPVQPEVVDHGWLRESFGKRLAYYGGISTQTVLPFGSPAEVKQAAAKCLSLLAPEKTGLILAPSHRLMSDVPLENVEAMLEYFKSM